MAEQAPSREDKQLPASERRLRQAREEGQVARSRDFGHIMLLALTFGTFAMLSGSLSRQATNLFKTGLRFDAGPHESPQAVLASTLELALDGFWLLLPTAAAGMLAAFIAAVVPGGLTMTGAPLVPKWNRVSPIAGLSRLFARGHLIDSLKLTVIIGLLALVGVLYVVSTFADFARLISLPLGPAMSDAWRIIVPGAAAMLLLIFVAAAIDVPMQWFRHRGDLRMTREEARKEHKESDGDPHQKARLRARQREISTARMMTAVPKADVVINNPTHYSVALVYQGDGMRAPRVVAKGADLVALRIREIAAHHGVPQFEAPPLARALFAHVKIDQEIPGSLYGAVAQILAYVYALRQTLPRGARPVRAPDVRDLQVPPELDPANAVPARAD